MIIHPAVRQYLEDTIFDELTIGENGNFDPGAALAIARDVVRGLIDAEVYFDLSHTNAPASWPWGPPDWWTRVAEPPLTHEERVSLGIAAIEEAHRRLVAQANAGIFGSRPC